MKLLLSLFLLFQSNVTGFWAFRTPVPDGTFRESFFDLKQDGESVTGTMIQGLRRTSLSEGWLRNGKLHFSVILGGPNNSTRVVNYDGEASGGKINLTSGNNSGVLERSTMSAAVPVRLPLPELHDVRDNGLVRTPPMGWNSWNKFAGRVTAEDVRGMADAMVSSGMAKAGYVYVNIDDTWELGRDAQGNPTTNKKFPDMKALADYVHSKGLKIGIYSSPGPKTCAGYEGSYGHVAQDAKTWAAWGIDYLKYDLCSDLDVYKDDAPTLQAIYQEMGEALQGTKRPIVYSLCEYGRAEPWTGWGEKSGGNLWRTTGDISDRWQSMDRIGFSQLKIASYAKPGHWNDPDMLEIGNGGMTADEYRTHMSLWSLLAAPLIAGNDLRSMTDETKSILENREVIAIDQDSNYKPVVSVSSNNGLEVLMRPLSDGSVVVGLFNRTEAPVQMSFPRSSLPASFAGKKLELHDLWQHAPATMTGDNFTSTVPTHGVVLVKFTAH
jgi:alpha-galactosidase